MSKDKLWTRKDYEAALERNKDCVSSSYDGRMWIFFKWHAQKFASVKRLDESSPFSKHEITFDVPKMRFNGWTIPEEIETLKGPWETIFNEVIMGYCGRTGLDPLHLTIELLIKYELEAIAKHKIPDYQI